jgi:hypothetical protein
MVSSLLSKSFIAFRQKKIQLPVLNGLNIFLLAIIGSMLFYVMNNQFKVIEGNKLRETGEDSDGAKNEAEAPYTITNEVLPSADHVTER